MERIARRLQPLPERRLDLYKARLRRWREEARRLSLELFHVSAIRQWLICSRLRLRSQQVQRVIEVDAVAELISIRKQQLCCRIRHSPDREYR